jgi:hypothetical protein
MNRRRVGDSSGYKQFTYGDVLSYIRESKLSRREYYRYYRGLSSNEHLEPIIAKYGDVPQLESNCESFNALSAELYQSIFNLEPPSNDDKTIVPSKSIELLYKYRFYDPGVMQFIKCSLMAMFTNQSLDKISQFWIHNIKRIGEPSADGEVSLSKVGGYSELVVFKVSKNPKNVYATMYEGLVGHEVNKLRQMGNVNYAYTYGVIKCGHKNFCKPEDTVLMQEFVKGISYESYVRRISDPSEFMSAILQLTFSLNWSYEESVFQHCDLHNQNVMARDTDRSSFYIPYNYNDRTVYVKSKKVMTIIDFGRSAIRVKSGKGELVYSADTPDSNPQVLSPLADIFKLLGFTLYRAERPITEVKKIQDKVYRFDGSLNEWEQVVEKEPATHPAIIEVVKELMKFFLDIEELNSQEIVEKFRDTYYVLYKIRRELTFTDFLIYIKNNPKLRPYWKELVKTRVDPDQVLECRSDCVIPSSLIPNPASEVVTDPLDFLIRVNEGWKVKVENWDALIGKMERYAKNRDPNVVGLRDLLRGSLKSIPQQYRSRVERLIR